jgi:peptidoglycan/LPS O-acetylase OafA/YrhL
MVKKPSRDHQRPGVAWLDSGRIPALDGIRGVAISLVLLAHAGDSAGWGFAQGGRPLSFGGQLGVDLFFVISGLLITTLLLREWDRSGRIALRDFYLRRCLRILPASYAYLLFAAGLVACGVCRVPRGEWIAALLYAINFFPGPAKVIGHFWSLSVEEQFYLFWPPLLAAMIAGRGGVRPTSGVAASLVMALVARVAILAFLPGYYGASRWWTPTRIDGIAAGCLMALVVREQGGVARLDRFARGWPAWAIACVSVQVWGRKVTPFASAFVPTLEAAAMAGLIWSAARTGPRWLDRGPLARLGVLSYGVYLWQQPFLLPDRPGWLSTWPQNLALTLALAVTSHFLIERPFLRLKDRVGRGRPTFPPDSPHQAEVAFGAIEPHRQASPAPAAGHTSGCDIPFAGWHP